MGEQAAWSRAKERPCLGLEEKGAGGCWSIPSSRFSLPKLKVVCMAQMAVPRVRIQGMFGCHDFWLVPTAKHSSPPPPTMHPWHKSKSPPSEPEWGGGIVGGGWLVGPRPEARPSSPLFPSQYSLLLRLALDGLCGLGKWLHICFSIHQVSQPDKPTAAATSEKQRTGSFLVTAIHLLSPLCSLS